MHAVWIAGRNTPKTAAKPSNATSIAAIAWTGYARNAVVSRLSNSPLNRFFIGFPICVYLRSSAANFSILRSQPLDQPIVMIPPRKSKPVMHAIFPALPEFQGIGHDPVTAPEIR